MLAAVPSNAKRSVWTPAPSSTSMGAVCANAVPAKPLSLAALESGKAKLASAAPVSRETEIELPPTGVLAFTDSA